MMYEAERFFPSSLVGKSHFIFPYLHCACKVHLVLGILIIKQAPFLVLIEAGFWITLIPLRK